MLEKSKYNVTPSNVEKEYIADLGESTYKQMWNVIILALVYCLKDMLAQRVCAKIINSGQIQVEFFQGSSFFYFFMALIRVNYLNWIWFGIFMTLTMVFSKPIWIWFGICVSQNTNFSFQIKLELVWKILRIFWVYLFQTKLDLVWKRTLNEM